MMRKLAGWVSLALCMYELKAEFNKHLYPSIPEYFDTPCVFPFSYDELIYYSCVSIHSDYAWCSLDETFRGRWRYCTSNDLPMCTFPFIYRHKYFQKCITDGYILNRTWCSLTSNYDEDKKWKQCSPYKPPTPSIPSLSASEFIVSLGAHEETEVIGFISCLSK